MEKGGKMSWCILYEYIEEREKEPLSLKRDLLSPRSTSRSRYTFVPFIFHFEHKMSIFLSNLFWNTSLNRVVWLNFVLVNSSSFLFLCSCPMRRCFLFFSFFSCSFLMVARSLDWRFAEKKRREKSCLPLLEKKGTKKRSSPFRVPKPDQAEKYTLQCFVWLFAVLYTFCAACVLALLTASFFVLTWK